MAWNAGSRGQSAAGICEQQESPRIGQPAIAMTLWVRGHIGGADWILLKKSRLKIPHFVTHQLRQQPCGGGLLFHYRRFRILTSDQDPF
jgi:hypothetical protein